MKVHRHADPVSFRAVVEDHLLADDARHNLMSGLLGTLIEQPDVYPHFDLWRVEDGGATVGVALRTRPHLLVLAKPRDAGVLEALANAIASEDAALPGVVGALPEAETFADLYGPLARVEIGTRMDQAIHVLERVEKVPVPSGAARSARKDDFDLVLAWHKAFAEEAGGPGHADEEQTRRRLRHRIAKERGEGFRIWEDGEPVCLVGWVAAAAGTMRVGPVYTPPEHRCHGYATGLVADVSRRLLGRGLRSCLLYTDLANPSSNAIYRRVGYRVACDSAMIAFSMPDRVPAGP